MLEIQPLPVLDDNYTYLLRTQGRGIVIVDPAESGPVLRALEVDPGPAAAILLTHHHADHVGGVAGLLEALGPLPVYGPRQEAGRIPALTRPVEGTEELEVAGERVHVLPVPGHTAGHVAYHLPARGHLFSGDSLFGAGCGRLFEGTPEQMLRSLERLAALPDETRVWCGHEYTRSNLRFALSLEPDHAELLARLAALEIPSVPLHLGLEKRTNPFLRCRAPAFQEAMGLTDPVALFAAIRAAKDRFR